jgi:hypothetical protein
MGDRCYMWIKCRKADAEKFEEHGFVLDAGGNKNTPTLASSSTMNATTGTLTSFPKTSRITEATTQAPTMARWSSRATARSLRKQNPT